MTDEPREQPQAASEPAAELALPAPPGPLPTPPAVVGAAGVAATSADAPATDVIPDVVRPSADAPATDVIPDVVPPSAAAQTLAPPPVLAPPAALVPAPSRDAPPRLAGAWSRAIAERPERAIEIPRLKLAAQSRRDFLLFAAGAIATGIGAWWLLPERARSRLVPGALHHPLDTLAARTGLNAARRERLLDRALTVDDDIAEALYSRGRRVRTYDRSQVTPLRNNYDGMTPGPGYLPNWTLRVSGLASGAVETLRIGDLLGRFELHEQVTRLVCVEGWSAVAWWGGIRFADFLRAFPPAPSARWAGLRSAVNLDGSGRPDPYYVSIDLETARHPQTLLATHQGGRPLSLEHGAPLRLLVPMKLGLKNIKAITEIEYTTAEPRDFWNQRGYSKYDGL